MTEGTGEIVIRPGTQPDTEACFSIFIDSATDLVKRLGSTWDADAERIWGRFESMYRRLGDHAAEWWVAENSRTGELVGYARSVGRSEGLFELTEFFVRPSGQSAGVGRRLLERAFPEGGGDVRAIIATIDLRAISRYYRAGTVARFPIMSLTGTPGRTDGTSDIAAVLASTDDIGTMASLERDVLGFARDADEIAWLLEEREGYVYRRGTEAIGLGFVGASGAGPILSLDPAAQVPILSHIEARAVELGIGELTFEVPMINEVAMRHLLGRGYQMDQFMTLLLSSRPFGQFDRFIGFSPPFIL